MFMLKKILLVLIAGLGMFSTCVGSEVDRPNIVIIMADDLGMRDLQLYDGWIKTPRIEAMAKEGMTLHDFHTNSSVCSPTRAALMTGRYQQRVGIVDVIVGNETYDKGLPANLPTMGKIFKQNHYATGLFGKWHLGFLDKFNPVHHGFDEFTGLLHGAADFHVRNGWRKGLEKYEMPGYATDIITEMSVDFIERHKEKPFFLFVSHQTPHNPYQTRADTLENRKEGWKENAISEENRPRYQEMVKDLDDSVGIILDKLKEEGVGHKTLVFLMSDNGDVGMSPVKGHLRGTKFGHEEGGHRVPAVAWWPGRIKPESKSSELLIGFDLFPTFTEIAGIKKDNPENLDGVSFANHLLNQAPVADRKIFFGYEPKLGTAMRHGKWKMVVKEADVKLYDLENDLKEMHNVADQNPKIAESMRADIEQFKATVLPGT